MQLNFPTKVRDLARRQERSGAGKHCSKKPRCSLLAYTPKVSSSFTRVCSNLGIGSWGRATVEASVSREGVWEMMPVSMRRARFTVLATSLVLASSWPAIAMAEPRDPWTSGKKVSFETLQRGLWGGCTRPTVIACRHDCEWENAMAVLATEGALVANPLPAPSVDWARHSVVLVALGRVEGMVEVRGARRIGNRLFLDVYMESGGASGHVDQAPFHLVALDTKAVGPIEVNYVSQASPGMPSQAHRQAGCGSVPESSDPVVEGSDAMTSTPTSTWGMLKARYR